MGDKDDSSSGASLDVESARSPHILSSDAVVPHTGDDSAKESGGGFCSYFSLGMTAGSTGTYFGFAILVCSMLASVLTQAYSPEDEAVRTKWLINCPAGYESSCLANQAVLRYSCALVVLYGLNIVMTMASAKLYDSYWIIKTLFFGGILTMFFYLDASNFNNDGYAWFARIGGFLYIMLQQVILLDFALSWNETWIAKSNAESGITNNGMDRWKWAILSTGFGLFILSIVALSVMFKYFGGCSANDTILALGITISVLGFVYQMLFTRIGSVLTSGVMSAYYAYICFSAVTLNPDSTCNPSISSSPQTWSTVIGLLITVCSLSWTCYSTILSLPAQAVTGVEVDDKIPYATPGLRSILLSVSGIFVLGSCYYAMVLTNWATQQSHFSMGNARIGEAAMWLQGSASWICFLMYIWALTAPMIWPERFGVDPRQL